MSELLDLTDQIAELERKRQSLKKEISRLSGKMRLIAARHTLDIWQATDKKGRRIYSNERVREAELLQRLHNDKEYQELREKLERLEDEYDNLLIEIERLREKREILMIESGLHPQLSEPSGR